MTSSDETSSATRRGRPPGTSARELELIALSLFSSQGFEETTVEHIAAAAGVSRRTFFRYFESKTAVLWHGFDNEVKELGFALAQIAPEVAMMEAIRIAVIGVNRYRTEDVAELRTRMNLIASVPALQASAAAYFEAWERVLSNFAAGRLGETADALIPMTIGRTVLAACRTAYDQWVTRADLELTDYLDAAIRALARGFSD